MIKSAAFSTVVQFFKSQAGSTRGADYKLVEKIRSQASKLYALPETDLQDQMTGLRTSVQGKDRSVIVAGDIMSFTFSLVVEAARRILCIELYDVQLLAGIALARGHVAEMQTGEGKTFATMLPASLFAIAGEGVHVMTVNAYLAQRDFELLAPVYGLLGLSVGLIESKTDTIRKRSAYACDITYGPGYEFGFDYLRDQVALLSRPKPALGERTRDRLHDRVSTPTLVMQRGHAVAVLDEADSVMIDEATTPLVLSVGCSQSAANANVYLAAMQAASRLEKDRHFVLSNSGTSLHITHEGLGHISSSQVIPNRGLDRPWQIYVEQALKGEHLYHRDTQYIVQDGEVRIVDQYTGRIFVDRSWQDGLHQAIQAKEGVTITTEMQSIARVTRQRFFRRYEHLCGMSGTASGCERELRQVYNLRVVEIPTNRPSQRKLLPTRVFQDIEAKEQAIVSEIVRIQSTQQPVLVGTASIDFSIRLGKLLGQQGIAFQLLNGTQDADEADIVASAGQPGVVTIATNMAGRGTDIKLGPSVAELGGLHVIAAEPQESVRIDRQLFGRAARQGDPGSCQLFVSGDDLVLKQHAPKLAKRIKQLADIEEKSQTILIAITQKISELQLKIEAVQSQQRGQMFAQDDWLEKIVAALR